MTLRFISHRELAFRQLLGMLRIPPFAMLNYYSNLFLSAKFVFADQPEKVRFIDKEIRRIECLVGVMLTTDSYSIQQFLEKIWLRQAQYRDDMLKIEAIIDGVSEKEKKELIKIYNEVLEKNRKLEIMEHYLLFKLQPLMDLKMIETYMDNNMDLKSYFKEQGKRITQLELGAELDKIKKWIYGEAVQLMPFIRFTKLE